MSNVRPPASLSCSSSGRRCSLVASRSPRVQSSMLTSTQLLSLAELPRSPWPRWYSSAKCPPSSSLSNRWYRHGRTIWASWFRQRPQPSKFSAKMVRVGVCELWNSESSKFITSKFQNDLDFNIIKISKAQNLLGVFSARPGWMQGAKNKGEVPTGVVLSFCFVLLHHADDRNIQGNRSSQRSIG